MRVTLRLTTRTTPWWSNQAVQTGQDGICLRGEGRDRTVELRPVVTGSRVDQELVIERGLELGEA